MTASIRWAGSELDLRTRQLRVNGQPVTLGARAFDLLAVLVQQAGQVVGKDTLLDQVWPHLVVEESNLAVQVHALRRVLGPGAIVTVPGRGYQFTLPLEGVARPAALAPLPLAANDAATRHLPPDPRADWFGRAETLDAVLAQLRGPQRLLTLLGAGGAGKTTLALAAAHALAAEGPAVAWVELSSLADASQLAGAVAQATRRTLFPSGDPARALCRALTGWRGLLVLDGAEALCEAVVGVVPGLLAASADLRVLATSQTPLQLPAETVMRIGSLPIAPLGSTAEAARAFPAVALFEERGRMAQRRFRLEDRHVDLAIRICQRCDGLPFAIELAAAALAMFSLPQLAARLAADQPLGRHARPDAPPRQHTVRAALTWSHALLTPLEQRVFRRLGVFPSSFRLDMAEVVCGDEATSGEEVVDALSVLVHRSIVECLPSPVPDAPDRYRLLDTARRFARRQLQAHQEAPAVAHRHLQAVGAMARATRRLGVGAMPLRQYREVYGPELGNCRAALDWAVAHDRLAGLRLIADGYPLFAAHGRGDDMRDYCEAFLPLVPQMEDEASEPAGRFCLMAAVGYRFVDRGLFHRYHRLAIDIFTRHGHTQRVHWSLCMLAVQPDVGLDERAALVERAMALEDPSWLKPPGLAMRCMAQAECAVLREDHAAMRAHVQQAQAAVRGQASQMELDILENWAAFELLAGDVEHAKRLARQADELNGGASGAASAESIGLRVECHLRAGETAQARALAPLWQRALHEVGWANQVIDVAPRLPLLCAQEHRWFDAARLLGHAQHLLQAAGFERLGPTLSSLLHHPALAGLDRALSSAQRDRLLQSGRGLHPQDAFTLAFDGQDQHELAPVGSEPAPGLFDAAPTWQASGDVRAAR